MSNRFSIRLYLILTTLLVGTAVPASAQFQPRTLNDPATGEDYIIEGSAGFWFPKADMRINGEGLGIPGSDINLKTDLGLTDQRFSELHAVLRATPGFKLRFQYIPILYQQSGTLTRNIVFNGEIYRIGLPVNSVLDWKAYRFGFEFDFIRKNRGFGGLLLEAKYTDVRAELQSPVTSGFYHPKAPIPAIGGIVRYYIVPNISITGELSGIKIPDVVEEISGHYADFDIYGTINLTNNVGAQLGYRSFDVGYLVDGSAGSFKLKGMYFGVVARY